MRILRVAQKCYPDVMGGGPYHVHAMSRDQAAMGHDVTVLTVDPEGDRPHVEERAGYTVVRYPVTASLLGNDISAGVASYLRTAGEYDVMHAHSHLYFSTNLAALARAAGGPPLALTNHGLYSQNAPEWLFDLYLRSVGRWTFERADAVFCYTEEDRERVREFGVGSRIEVVSNGIDTERFRPDGPESERVDVAGPVVLFVGRLVEGKRPGDVVRAVARLRETHPGAELYLCGEGPLREELEGLAADLGVGDVVHFFGHVAYDEMPRVYRAGDALVLPSRAEGIPRTVIEAIGSGIPVVASDLEQVAPVVERAGVAVPVGDVAGFAAGLGQVLDGDHGENIGDHGLMDHQYSLHDTLLHVPLVIHGGSFTGGTVDDLVQLTDLAPTLLDEVGIDAPEFREQAQGRSFHPDADTEPRGKVVAEYMAPQPSMEALKKRVGDLPAHVYEYDRSLRALRTEEWKLIRGSDGSRRLYHVASDPEESEDVADENPEVVSRLEGELDEWLDSFEHAEHTGDVSMREETRERLEDLGYLQ